MKTKIEEPLNINRLKSFSKKLNLIKPANYKNSKKTNKVHKKFAQLTKAELQQSFLESFPYVALLIKAETKEIVASNKAGIEAGAVPGKKCYESWANRDKPCPWCQVSKLQKTGESVCCESEIKGRIFNTYWAPISEDLFLHFAEDMIYSNKRLINEQIALTKSQSALKEVLKSIEKEQKEKMKIVQSNINKIVFPNIRNLEKGASESQSNYISLLKKNLSEITSPFISKLESCYTKLSPRELEICSLIKEGMSSKDIAVHFNTSEGTVRNQRKSIRKKLGIKNEPTNLTTYLRSEI